eukprot:scaffold3953_cov169-Amphora_coffeaeformis.AAC.30
MKVIMKHGARDHPSMMDSPHERQVLIHREEDHTLADVENDKGAGPASRENPSNENRGLLRMGIEAVHHLVSCSWAWKPLYFDPLDPEASKSQPRSVDWDRVVSIIKNTISMGLLIFCVYIIIAGIFARETPIAMSMHPMVALVAMWLLILWLGILEGAQGALVGLQPIDKESYAETHPITLKCATLAHKGNNINRFIVGRQFLVVLVIFCLNLCCTVVENAVVPGFSRTTVGIFLESGLSVMLITVILGQLSAEVNATDCMLDFINTSVAFVTAWICLAIETSGLLHSVYLVQYFMALVTGIPVKSDDGPRTVTESIFFWVRVLFSLSLVCYTMATTLAALLNYETTMYEGLPNMASIVIFVFLICFLGMLEAMQIALFAVVNLPEEALDGHFTAQKNCRLAFCGNNFQAFLIGRQICVTMCMFLLARITTTEVNTKVGQETFLGMSDAMQAFFNTGLPGALITTIVASLVWRIFASSFPVEFMGNPFVYYTIRLCLVLEATGVFSASWLLADILKKVVGLQLDEMYITISGQRECDNTATNCKKLVDDEENVLKPSSSSSSTITCSSRSSAESTPVTTYGSTTNKNAVTCNCMYPGMGGLLRCECISI